MHFFVTIPRCMFWCVTRIANNFKILTWIWVLIKIWILVSILIVIHVMIWSLIGIRILIDIPALIIILTLIEIFIDIWIWIEFYVKIQILLKISVKIRIFNKISTWIILIRITVHILITPIEVWFLVESISLGKIRVGWKTIYTSIIVSTPLWI